MAEISDLVSEVERLRVADDEVLVVRPKGFLTTNENGILHRNLRLIASLLGIDIERIVVLDREVELTVVKADQMELA